MGSKNSIHENIKENFFNKIDSKEKAYWLGFLYADGCIKGNRVILCLSTKDINQLYNFCSSLGLDKNKIKTYLFKNGKYSSSTVIIRNKNMVSDLAKRGCLQKKFSRIRFPDLGSEELSLAFLLGFYDGDGYERGSIICSTSLDFLNDIKNTFKITWSPKNKKNKNEKQKLYILCIGWELKNKMLANYENSMLRKRIYNSGQSGFKKGVCYRKFKTYRIDRRIEDLQKDVINKSIYAISKELEVPQKYLTSYLRKNGVIVPSAKQKNISKRKFVMEKEELEKLIKIYSIKSIGESFGVSDNAVRKRAKLFGILEMRKNKNIRINLCARTRIGSRG